MSVADRLGLPEAFQATVLILASVLALAPYFSGATLGSLVIPRLDARRRRALRLTGPLAVMVAVALGVPIKGLQPRSPQLRILAAELNEQGDADLVVSNSGPAPAVLTAIELEVVRDHGIAGRPPLAVNATYYLPIGDLREAQRRKLAIRHLVPPGGTERIVVSPSTARALTLQVRLYSDGAVVLARELVPAGATRR